MYVRVGLRIRFDQLQPGCDCHREPTRELGLLSPIPLPRLANVVLSLIDETNNHSSRSIRARTSSQEWSLVRPRRYRSNRRSSSRRWASVRGTSSGESARLSQRAEMSRRRSSALSAWMSSVDSDICSPNCADRRVAHVQLAQLPTLALSHWTLPADNRASSSFSTGSQAPTAISEGRG
jgi:hypothetical protein